MIFVVYDFLRVQNLNINSKKKKLEMNMVWVWRLHLPCERVEWVLGG